MDDEGKIKAAMKQWGVKKKDVLHSRVKSTGEVVLIVGPGKKITITLEGGLDDQAAVSEPPAVTQEAAPGAVTFESLVPDRIWAILEREGLTDPEALRGKTDRALEELEGLGRASIKRLRAILDRLG